MPEVFSARDMTTPVRQTNTKVSAAFISQARELLTQDYLPKVERCLEQLSDEQVWWRANDKSTALAISSCTSRAMRGSGSSAAWAGNVMIGYAMPNLPNGASFLVRIYSLTLKKPSATPIKHWKVLRPHGCSINSRFRERRRQPWRRYFM